MVKSHSETQFRHWLSRLIFYFNLRHLRQTTNTFYRNKTNIWIAIIILTLSNSIFLEWNVLCCHLFIFTLYLLFCMQVLDTLAEIQERHDAVVEVERKLLELQQVIIYLFSFLPVWLTLNLRIGSFTITWLTMYLMISV